MLPWLERTGPSCLLNDLAEVQFLDVRNDTTFQADHNLTTLHLFTYKIITMKGTARLESKTGYGIHDTYKKNYYSAMQLHAGMDRYGRTRSLHIVLAVYTTDILNLYVNICLTHLDLLQDPT